LGYTNPEHAVVEESDKSKCLEFKNSEHNQNINNIKISSADQRKDLKNEILNFINEEHSKINMQIPFRTDIRGEINTVNDRALYSKQYPYAQSASDVVNSGISQMLKKERRPSRSPYNFPVLVVPKKGFNEDGTPKLRLVIDL